jgi:hypothetical protein
VPLRLGYSNVQDAEYIWLEGCRLKPNARVVTVEGPSVEAVMLSNTRGV